MVRGCLSGIASGAFNRGRCRAAGVLAGGRWLPPTRVDGFPVSCKMKIPHFVGFPALEILHFVGIGPLKTVHFVDNDIK